MLVYDDVAHLEFGHVIDFDPQNHVVIPESRRHAGPADDGVGDPPVEIGLISVKDLRPIVCIFVGDIFVRRIRPGTEPSDSGNYE